MTSPTTDSVITVVSGLPRSGTSLMMQMLAAAGIPPLTDGQRNADADNPRGYFELEAVKHLKRDSSWLASAQGKAIKVIHLLLPDLPSTSRYRLIFMHRDLDEVVASQRKMLERHGKPGAQLPAAALKAQYQAQLAQVDRVIALRPEFERLDVEHRRLLAAPLEQAARIAVFLGRPDQAAAMAATVDAELYRNRAT